MLILAASKLTRVVEVGESWWDTRDFGRIQNFLKVFLACGPEYAFINEPLPGEMCRNLVADRLDNRDQHELSRRKEYSLEEAFNKFLFRLVCWSLNKSIDDDVDYAEGSGTDKHAARVARGVGRLEIFLTNPQTSVPEVMESLGFPDASEYAPLEPPILNGALCQLSINDFIGKLGLMIWLHCHDDPFTSSWSHKCANNIVFRTECGYVGLAQDKVYVGEEVYLVDDASSIYILRPHKDHKCEVRLESNVDEAMLKISMSTKELPDQLSGQKDACCMEPDAADALDALPAQNPSARNDGGTSNYDKEV